MGCFGCCVERSEVPAVFLEPYIKGGYRLPNQPPSYYLKSLFFSHNELLNMWTALFSILCHLYLFQHCERTYTLWVLNFAGLSIHVFSFFAHTFSHSNPKVHIALYFFDFMGIYIGFSQVVPSFMVLHFNITGLNALLCGLMASVLNIVVFRNCSIAYFLSWRPWFAGGSIGLMKPRVLTFVKRGVWLYVLIWLSMNVKMYLFPPLSGSSKFHFSAIVSLILECFLLQSRWPECWYPDYFQIFRSHPFTHFFAGAVTLGLVTGFIQDEAKWRLNERQLAPYSDKGDFVLVCFSIFNIIYCYMCALWVVYRITSCSEDQVREGEGKKMN